MQKNKEQETRNKELRNKNQRQRLETRDPNANQTAKTETEFHNTSHAPLRRARNL
jgi:hypothetical protein